MIIRLTPFTACLAGLTFAPGLAVAQADSTFPGTLSCDALPISRAPVRVPVTVTIVGSRATYSFPAPAPNGGASGTETGGGVLGADRRLALNGAGKGSGFSYVARYAGEVGGRGGLLTGSQTWAAGGKNYTRPCQLTLGDGRG